MNEFALNTVDVVVIVGSLVIVVAVGLWTSRNVEKTARGYFLASGRMPWWLIGAAFVSTSVSSEQIVGTVGATYENGMGVVNWEWWALPVYSLVIVLFIPLYLKNRIATVPEFLSRRFGPTCGDIYSWVMLFAYVFVFLVPVMYGGTLAFHELTGWSFQAILWVTAAAVGVYTIKGGFRSVMWTDAVQCLMLVGGGVLLFFIALNHVPGGWSAMEAADPDRFHLYRPPNDPMAPFAGLLCGTVGVFLFYQSTNQVMIQRVLAARSTWDGIMGIIFAGFINLVRPMVTCFLGLIVYHWIHHLHRAEPLGSLDEAFPFSLKTFAPGWGLRGVVLAGFLAAVMSTTSALANATATIFSLDVYKRLLDKQASEARVVFVGRLAAGVALVAACLAAPLVKEFGGIFRYFQQGVTYVATPFISVILLGILWPRTNYTGALVGLIGGLALTLALALGLPAVGVDLHWFYVAGIAQAIIMSGVVVVSLASTPPRREQWEPFRWRFGLLSQYDEGVRRPWYQSLLLWYVVYAVIWVAIYWRFW
ncbi:MAG: sodium/solute symporter [Phycisphaerae bacterium]|nr:sodium/solute symporter [Phycisphaerae bacterium]